MENSVQTPATPLRAVQLAATPLPKGYEIYEIYLRRWLLDLRSRIAQLPSERTRLLQGRCNEFYPKGNKPGHGTRESNSFLLANAAR